MSEKTAESVIRDFLACLASGDSAGAVALFAEDGAIDMPGTGALPWAGRWTGKAKLVEYFEVMPAALEIRGHTQKVWVVDGDNVAVTGTEVAASRISGKEYTAKWAWVFTVKDGRILLWDAYEDTEAMFNCGPWRA
ncbi:nuclear transport factor 2 family protein [Methylobacterium organophilum]|uniref:SnoaL-like domain-containing protein n=1 Tax=Methylobacterium organophilum TaxID=410 RepID=A0ABQ4TF25_METOR|nr:nuclear transport factor 2 family protein [Methylobacterium organophilum]UMY16334.1 nuclear transport factor 2 family protein [Methylobacterium organophilum]GJE29651.1 hypothetical protein LKMONMHP_4535 [Methylobacterium organophilum]